MTVFSLMLTVTYCLVVGLDNIVWLASGYAHIFILLSIVIVTLLFKLLSMPNTVGVVVLDGKK